MTPKEKADALFNECRNAVFNSEYDRIDIDNRAKELSLSWVDEIIHAIEDVTPMHNFYWMQVKQEIEKL